MIGGVTLHPLFFMALFLILLVKGMAEFYSFFPQPDQKPFRIPGIITGALLFLSGFLFRYLYLPANIFLILPLAILALLAIPMFRKEGNTLIQLAVTLLGLLYVALPISLMTGLVYHPYQPGFNYQVALFLLVIIWLNDTGAYLTGMLIGKHKLFPRISPRKTWEGLAGGLAFACLASWLMRPLIPDIPVLHAWILTLGIVVSGTFGDLVESYFKRMAGVKDSGKFMPGHGGMLDRFDSLLFAIVLTFILINLL